MYESRSMFLGVAVSLSFLLSGSLYAQQGDGVKAGDGWPKLICCGSVVDPEEMMETPERLTELPFEGYLLAGNDNRNLPSGDLHISRSVFGPRRLRFEDYSRLIEYCRRMREIAPHVTENFLQTTTAPGTLADRPDHNEFEPNSKDLVMWFSDRFDAVLHNIKTAAQVAKAAGMRGLLVDIECYGGQIFNPNHLKDARDLGKSYDEMWTQIRLCGERYVKALQEGYAEATIFMYFTYEPAEADNYRLAAAFVDGIFAGSRAGTRIVAGHENYRLRSEADMLKAYWYVHGGMRQKCSVPEEYSKKVSAGLPMWLGALTRNHWNEERPGETCPPEEWRTALEHAVATADHYVWVYSEGYHHTDWDNWWDCGVLPQVYIDYTFEVMREARPIYRGYWRENGLRRRATYQDWYDTNRELHQRSGFEDRAEEDWDALVAGLVAMSASDVLEGWKMMWDVEDEGVKEGWYRDDVAEEEWFEVETTTTWENQRVGQDWQVKHGRPYDGVAWYRTRFRGPETAEGKRVFLSFGAVDDGCEVWVNERMMLMRPFPYRGDRHSWRKPFAVDITAAIHSSGPNLLAVRVSDTTGGGGIWKPVRIITLPKE